MGLMPFSADTIYIHSQAVTVLGNHCHVQSNVWHHCRAAASQATPVAFGTLKGCNQGKKCPAVPLPMYMSPSRCISWCRTLCFVSGTRAKENRFIRNFSSFLTYVKEKGKGRAKMDPIKGIKMLFLLSWLLIACMFSQDRKIARQEAPAYFFSVTLYYHALCFFHTSSSSMICFYGL